MIAQISTALLISGISGCYAVVIGVIYWVYGISKDKVDNKLCNTIQEHNKDDHQNIRKWIEDSENRNAERHKELKADLKEVKQLIIENGRR